MRRDRAFTLAAIAMLALAIGLTATVFTIMDATLFPGYPLVKRNDRLRIVLRHRVHEMIVQKKTRDEIARMLLSDLHRVGVAGQVLMAQSFDGLIGELQ